MVQPAGGGNQKWRDAADTAAAPQPVSQLSAADLALADFLIRRSMPVRFARSDPTALQAVRRTLCCGSIGALALCRFVFRLLVYTSLGKLGQGFVGGLFLLERLVEKLYGLGKAEFFSPRAQCPVPRNFVMLDSLGRR